MHSRVLITVCALDQLGDQKQRGKLLRVCLGPLQNLAKTKTRLLSEYRNSIWQLLGRIRGKLSVAHPTPGSGAFFYPWIRDGKKFGSGIRDEHPRSFFR
jgi:hypothetical protein